MKTIKTTVYLNAADYRKLKSLAADEGRAAAELVREAVAEYTARATERKWPRSIGMGDSGDPHFAERYEDYLDGFGAEGIDDTEVGKPSLPRWPYRHNDPGDKTP